MNSICQGKPNYNVTTLPTHTLANNQYLYNFYRKLNSVLTASKQEGFSYKCKSFKRVYSKYQVMSRNILSCLFVNWGFFLPFSFLEGNITKVTRLLLVFLVMLFFLTAFIRLSNLQTFFIFCFYLLWMEVSRYIRGDDSSKS